MSLVAEYRDARHDENIARLRRVLALRGMHASGMTQREIAASLGISQPAVAQQLKAAPRLTDVHAEALLEASAPVLVRLAEERGFTKLAVYGSVARHDARADSDIDLIVQPPPDTTIGELLALRGLFSAVVGRGVDLTTYGGLKPSIDDDIRREAVRL